MISLDICGVNWTEALSLFGLIRMTRRSTTVVGSLGCRTVLPPTRQVGWFTLGQMTEMAVGRPTASQQTQHIPLFVAKFRRASSAAKAKVGFQPSPAHILVFISRCSKEA